VVWVFALQEPHRQAEERIIKKSPEDKERDITETAERDLDLGKILEERQRLESLLKEKFTRVITVMFTDCKGSTTITELEGDMAWRLILKHHNDILFQAAKLNKNRKTAVPVQIRIGVHTGSGIVEKHDIFGDVVNVAARFEGLANPDEIYFSEDTFNALSDKEEINCRFIKKSRVKGKSQPYKIYRAFWKEGEFEKAAFEGYSLKLRESGGAKRTIPISKNEITIN
jgi:class 3 adenylate cyclase